MAYVGPFHSETATSATLDQALTSVMNVQTRNYNRLFCRVTASVQAFDQFQIDAKPHGASTVYATIAGPTTSGDFTSPTRPLLGCSGNLAALSGATGWFYMDVEGIDTVDIKLAFGADNGTYVIDVGLQ
jgi:hypothetical protein|tara:strand:+ start:2213 stop:2599 length:387 start_codon:yes stop_codon:yes gene_type:complete